MGGYGGAIVDGLSKIAAKGLDKLGSAIEHSASIEHGLEQHPESKPFIESYHDTFSRVKSQYVSKELAAAHADTRFDISTRVDITKHPDYDPKVHTKPGGIDPKTGAQLPPVPRTVGRINPDTGKILSDKPINAAAIETEGTRLAREQWLGKGDVAGVFAAHQIEQKYGLAAAESFSDNIAFLLKDNQKVRVNPKQPATTNISTFKRNVQNAGIKLKTSDPTYYPKTPLERSITSYSYKAFSPLLAIPHIATFFNGMFGTDASTFMKAAFHGLNEGLGKNSDHWQALVDTGAMTDSLMREVGFYNKYISSDRAFQLPNESIIPRLNKMFMQPGFSYLRDMTLVQGGLTGKMTAEQLGRDFVANPTDKKLLWQMREFNLDPAKILRQKGNLDSEDLDKAIFKFVDKHYFVDNTMQRSMLLQASPSGRIFGMYHGYVTRQAKMMYHALSLDYKQRGLGAILRNYAVAGIVFPMIGEGIKTLEAAVRGQDAFGNLRTDAANITGQHGISKALDTYLQALSHIGAFGVWSNMIRGTLTHSLATTLTGPVGRAATDILQDSGSAVGQIYKKGTHNTARSVRKSVTPLARDISYDIPGISLLANLLDHRFLPKKNERPAKDPLREVYNDISTSKSNTATDPYDLNK